MYTNYNQVSPLGPGVMDYGKERDEYYFFPFPPGVLLLLSD
jgi:hypothetical protein